jgi:hypothetical protein
MSNAEINALNKELADLQSQKKALVPFYADLETKIFRLNDAIDEKLTQQAAFKINDNRKKAIAAGYIPENPSQTQSFDDEIDEAFARLGAASGCADGGWDE